MLGGRQCVTQKIVIIMYEGYFFMFFLGIMKWSELNSQLFCFYVLIIDSLIFYLVCIEYNYF